MRSAASAILALAATAQAVYTGFNYGNTFTDGTAKGQSDFETEFKTAKGLEGTNGAFTSARLYTMIQGGTTNDPISAIPAAMNTGTSLLLGMWCSAGDAAFANELAALKSAITKYGSSFASLVAGISVGSEDLYRMTPTSIENGGSVGAQPDTIADYISQVRKAIAGTALANVKIGHVDTWTAWTNSSNQAVIDACDWVGVDEYPYWEKQHKNDITQAKSLFDNAVSATAAAVGNKEVWITEAGWAVSGETVGDAVASLDNAKTFWDQVGCPMFGVKNVWWYTLQDASPTAPNPSFGVIGSTMTTTPLYDLSCANVTTTGSSSNSTGSGSGSGNGTSSSGSGSSSGSSSGSGSSSSSGSKSGSNSTVTSSSPTSTSTHLTSGSAATAAQGMGAALLAIFAAMFAL